MYKSKSLNYDRLTFIACMWHIQAMRMGDYFFNMNPHGHKYLHIWRPALSTSLSICTIIMCEGNSDLCLNITNVYGALAEVLHKSSCKEISYQVQQICKPLHVTTTTPVCVEYVVLEHKSC